MGNSSTLLEHVRSCQNMRPHRGGLQMYGVLHTEFVDVTGCGSTFRATPVRTGVRVGSAFLALQGLDSIYR